CRTIPMVHRANGRNCHRRANQRYFCYPGYIDYYKLLCSYQQRGLRKQSQYGSSDHQHHTLAPINFVS
ncbi:MAG TPA: hypothetical protein PLS06_07340, partial [Proteiniphilum sp.]|nr:hypothetical protein [Proteiniphilum sp.]